MTDEPPGFEPEPTNYQLMAALQQLAAGQQALAQGQQALAETMAQSFAHLATEISGVKADVDELGEEV
jgi:hypothetical protein